MPVLPSVPGAGCADRLMQYLSGAPKARCSLELPGKRRYAGKTSQTSRDAPPISIVRPKCQALDEQLVGPRVVSLGSCHLSQISQCKRCAVGNVALLEFGKRFLKTGSGPVDVSLLIRYQPQRVESERRPECVAQGPIGAQCLFMERL